MLYRIFEGQLRAEFIDEEKHRGDELIHLADVAVPEMQGEPVCVSVGITFCTKDSGMDFREIYEKADQGVYHSKKTDGSQVTYVSIDSLI